MRKKLVWYFDRTNKFDIYIHYKLKDLKELKEIAQQNGSFETKMASEDDILFAIFGYMVSLQLNRWA